MFVYYPKMPGFRRHLTRLARAPHDPGEAQTGKNRRIVAGLASGRPTILHPRHHGRRRVYGSTGEGGEPGERVEGAKMPWIGTPRGGCGRPSSCWSGDARGSRPPQLAERADRRRGSRQQVEIAFSILKRVFRLGETPATTLVGSRPGSPSTHPCLTARSSAVSGPRKNHSTGMNAVSYPRELWWVRDRYAVGRESGLHPPDEVGRAA